jgi:GT2 family glycosyltransferase
MTTNSIKLLIILITYNSEKWIKKNLDSIGRGHDILIIDNGSIDNTLEIIKNEYPAVRLIESEINLGFAKANNLGFEIAKKEKYDLVFLVNHDAWVGTNTIEGLVDFMKSHSDFGIVSPIHFSGNGVDYDKGFLHFCCESEIIKSLENRTQYIEVASINGAFMMLSRKCIETLKGFDPIFQFYGEDVDLCNRAKLSGFRIGILNNYKAFHDRGERKMTNSRLFNHIKANQLIQIKNTKGNSYLIVFLKSVYSIIFLGFKRFFKFELNVSLLYFKVIPILIKNYYEIKKSYFEYNS